MHFYWENTRQKRRLYDDEYGYDNDDDDCGARRSWELRLPSRARPSRLNYYRGAPARIVDCTASFIFKRKRGKEAEYRHNGRALETSARAPIAISTLCNLINATRVPRDLSSMRFRSRQSAPRCLLSFLFVWSINNARKIKYYRHKDKILQTQRIKEERKNSLLFIQRKEKFFRPATFEALFVRIWHWRIYLVRHYDKHYCSC